MITTRQINVNLEKGQKKSGHITTKSIDASIRADLPDVKGMVKPLGVTTERMADVADLAEKKRRDEIMAQREARQVVITEQKAAEIMSAAAEQGKEAIEVLSYAIKDEKEAKIEAMKKKGEFQEGMTVYQDEINEIAAREKALKLQKERDKERAAAARAEKKKQREIAKAREVAPVDQKAIAEAEKKVAMKERMAKVRAAKKEKK